MTVLYPYQAKGVEIINLFDGLVLLADDMGLGKTIQALTYIKQNPKIRPVVIICPAIVKWQWEQQARQHCGLRTIVCEGKRPPRRELLRKNPILVINYDILPYWANYLRRLRPQLVIVDEAQNIKSLGAKRTKAVRKLCTPDRRLKPEHLYHRKKSQRGKRYRPMDSVWWIDEKTGEHQHGHVLSVSKRTGYVSIRSQIRHIIAISGTPLTNRPAELYSTLHLLWPAKFPAFQTYAWEYCNPRKMPWGKWDYTGAKNLDRLHKLLKSCGMIRRLKKDVLKDLPPKIRIVVPMDVSKPKEYAKAYDDFLAWLRTKSPARAQRAAKAEELTKVGYLVRLAAELKMKAVYDWVDTFLADNDGKLVLFCHHKKIVKLLKNRYPKISVTVTGSTTKKNRREAVELFQHNPKIRLFIGNIRAAGTGIDLWRASTMAFVETGWVPGDCIQAEDRLHRIGQTAQVFCYYLVAHGTIEEHLCQILQRKQKIITQTLDGGTKRPDTKLDIYRQLIKECRHVS